MLFCPTDSANHKGELLGEIEMGLGAVYSVSSEHSMLNSVLYSQFVFIFQSLLRDSANLEIFMS